MRMQQGCAASPDALVLLVCVFYACTEEEVAVATSAVKGSLTQKKKVSEKTVAHKQRPPEVVTRWKLNYPGQKHMLLSNTNLKIYNLEDAIWSQVAVRLLQGSGELFSGCIENSLLES